MDNLLLGDAGPHCTFAPVIWEVKHEDGGLVSQDLDVH